MVVLVANLLLEPSFEQAVIQGVLPLQFTARVFTQVEFRERFLQSAQLKQTRVHDALVGLVCVYLGR